MVAIWRSFFATLVLAALSGCADIYFPRLLHPGSDEVQRMRAERFDPYPLTDVGPAVVGGRPLQYIRPAPENERVQNELAFEERYRQAPPPGLYKPTRGASARSGVTYVPGLPTLETAPPFTP